MARGRRRTEATPEAALVWGPEGPQHPQLKLYIDACITANFRPHPKQFELMKNILPPPYGYGVKRSFIKCGRKFGKSRGAAYLAHRFAGYYPGKRVYLLAPEQKQAGEIYWHSGDIPEFMTYKGERSKLLAHTDHQGMRQTFINGSYIKVDGSDNYNSQRGWNPDVIIADEFADFHPKWWDVMVPNLVARDGWLIIMGTPPEAPLLPDGTEHLFVQIFNQYTAEMEACRANKEPLTAYTTTGSSFDNPNLSRKAIEQEISRLERQGDFITIRREYYGEICFGGKNSIFPMFREGTHVDSHETIMARVKNNPERYEYYGLVDPGTTTVFGALFIAYDRYTGTPFFLDCLYETRPQDCTVDAIIPKFILKTEELGPPIQHWQLVCDSAAAWFIQEAIDRYALAFAPAQKRAGDKLEGIGLFKDVLLTREKFISDRCRAFATELVNYKTNDRGIPVKEWDHLIDLCRYFLKFSGYSLNEKEYRSPDAPIPRPSRPKWAYTTEPHEDDKTVDNYLLSDGSDFFF